MAEEDVIDIKNDDLASVFNDPTEYKGMIIDILKDDPSKLATKIRKKLENNIIDGETDMLLRTLSSVIPYNILIPVLRDQLGLSIQSDQDCVKSLKSLKSCLKETKDRSMIAQIIQYVNSTEGELPDEIVPEVDLLVLIDQIPVEKFPEIYNCIDYITQITE